MLALMVAGVGVAFVLGMVSSGLRTQRALRPLVKAAQDVGDGAFDQRLPIVGPRCAQEVALAINKVAVRIERAYHDLESFNENFALDMSERDGQTQRALLAAERLETEAAATRQASAREAARLGLRYHAVERISRHKSEFLASMSHELRTPLNAVIGFSELLLESVPGPLNGEQREFVKDIHASGRHLLALINDVLDLSKIEAGQMSYEDVLLDLRDPVGQAADLVRSLALKKEIRFELALELAVWVAGDGRRLRQVALNLLSNAVKFTAPGGTITVIVRPSAEHGFAELVVADSGVGIDSAHHELIFEPFRQVQDDGSAGAREGTGLGLALVRRFLTGMGGGVHVESTLGEGSRFIVRLPLARRAQSGETLGEASLTHTRDGGARA